MAGPPVRFPSSRLPFSHFPLVVFRFFRKGAGSAEFCLPFVDCLLLVHQTKGYGLG